MRKNSISADFSQGRAGFNASALNTAHLQKSAKKKRAMLVVNIEKEIVVKKNILECVCIDCHSSDSNYP